MRSVPRLCELYPSICLTTKEKHRRTSVKVVEKCPDIPVAAVQYRFTHKQYTERNIHNNKNTEGNKITHYKIIKKKYITLRIHINI
jgi:hypothetical protein